MINSEITGGKAPRAQQMVPTSAKELDFFVISTPVLNSVFIDSLKHEINNQDAENGWTPLHRAVYFGHLGITAQLLEAGASTTMCDFSGLMAWELAQLHVDKCSLSEARVRDIQ